MRPAQGCEQLSREVSAYRERAEQREPVEDRAPVVLVPVQVLGKLDVQRRDVAGVGEQRGKVPQDLGALLLPVVGQTCVFDDDRYALRSLDVALQVEAGPWQLGLILPRHRQHKAIERV